MSLFTFDLDSTLCDTRHRHHLINPDGKSTDWVAYSMACTNDEPVWPVIWMARALSASHNIAIVSGRDEAARDLTFEWLTRFDVPCDLLLLDNHARDGLPHEVYKEARIREATAYFDTFHIAHVDDWPPVALHLQRVGIQCIAVTPPRVLEDFNPDGHLTFV